MSWFPPGSESEIRGYKETASIFSNHRRTSPDNMKVLLLGVVCVALFAVASARPRFIAIPLDDVQFVEVEDFSAPLIRVARQAGFQATEVESDPEESGRFQRQAYGGGGGGGGGGDGHDYVDYGAHTGHHGAFGWYADFPVHKGH